MQEMPIEEREQEQKPKLEYVWHFHHSRLVEILESGYSSIEQRIKEIKKWKDKREIKLRIKLIKKVKGQLPLYKDGHLDYSKSDEIKKLHEEECPNCPYDSKRETIFTRKRWLTNNWY